MALLYLEDFEGYSNVEESQWRVSDNTDVVIDSSDYYHGTQGAYINSSYDWAVLNLPTNPNPIIIGMGFKQVGGSGTSSAGGNLQILGEGGPQLSLHQATTNMILHIGYDEGILGTSGVVPSANWYYIEIKMEISNSISAGNGILNVDGAEEISLSATTDTQARSTSVVTGIKMYAIYRTGGTTTRFDNIYVCDTNGSDNNDILGMPLIETLYPNGNGNQNDWVGSDADSTDNYLHVDDDPIDLDTSYAESDTTNEIDLYALEALSASYNIFGISVSTVAKIPYGGINNMQHVVRTASTDYAGATKIIAGNVYKEIQTIWENNPNDSNPWEKSDIDGLEAGVKVVA